MSASGLEFVAFFDVCSVYADDPSCSDLTAPYSTAASLRLHSALDGGAQEQNNPDTGGTLPLRYSEEFLDNVHASGRKSIIFIYQYFFAGYKALEDENYWWNAFAARIAPYVESGDVLAFYAADEPFYNAGLNASAWGLTEEEAAQRMTENLTDLATVVKGDFPDVPLFFTDNHFYFDDAFTLPEGYDWIGFDCYGPWDDCGGMGRSVAWYADTITASLSPEQRLVMYPQAFIQTADTVSTVTSEEEAALLTMTEQYQAYAESNPAVIGMIPFLYGDHTASGVTLHGANGMPSILEHYGRVSRCLE